MTECGDSDGPLRLAGATAETLKNPACGRRLARETIEKKFEDLYPVLFSVPNNVIVAFV
jgi:hypothetical protein